MRRGMRRDTCANCRFLESFDDHDETHIGLCRRMPPQVVVRMGMEPEDRTSPAYRDEMETHWPEVLIDDWCGEWQEARNDEP